MKHRDTLKRCVRTLATASALATLLLLNGCMYKTGSTEVGVRTVKWSLFGQKGVQEEVYQPGSTHFFLPFVNDWHTFDTRVQILEMTTAAESGDRPTDDDLRFKTVDGNDIGLDVVVTYRIDPKLAAKILQEVATDDLALREGIVRTISRSKPRDIFGELVTEEFYIATERDKKSDEVRQRLNEILNPYGVVVDQVNTNNYRFNEKYEAAIAERKLADQEAERLKSETRAKEAEYLTKVEEAKAEVETMMANALGEYERAVIEADAYYKQQELLAEAILAEGRATAEGVRKLNEALAGSGGEAMVKMKIAEALAGKRILMLPVGGGVDLRTTDMNQLLQLYGVKALAAPTTPTTK